MQKLVWKNIVTNMGFIFPIFFFIGGYLFFFTSNIWMPSTMGASAWTNIGETGTWNGREITLVRWDYCEKSNTMEVELDIRNTVYDGINSYDFSVIDGKGNRPDTEIIIEEPDWVIVQIKNVFKNWSELQLRMDMENNSSGEYYKAFTNVNDVNRVATIEKKDWLGYQIGRFESQITAHKEEIKQDKKAIHKLEKEKQEIKKEIARLQEGKKYETTSQQEDTDKVIADAEGKYSNAEKSILIYQEDISELEEEISLLQKEMEEVSSVGERN